MDLTEADEALVDQVVEEALKGFEKVTDPKELHLMRELIRADLLYSPEGQRRRYQRRSQRRARDVFDQPWRFLMPSDIRPPAPASACKAPSALESSAPIFRIQPGPRGNVSRPFSATKIACTLVAKTRSRVHVSIRVLRHIGQVDR